MKEGLKDAEILAPPLDEGRGCSVESYLSEIAACFTVKRVLMGSKLPLFSQSNVDTVFLIFYKVNQIVCFSMGYPSNE